MSSIDKIKAEIERRITDNTFGAKLELIDLLAFIDSLPDKPVKELEEAAGLYLDNHKPLTRYNWGDLQDAFIAGANWQKEQMMKEAVEGYVSDVIIHANGDELKFAVEYPIGKRPYSMGDKVKIIIVKEDGD